MNVLRSSNPSDENMDEQALYSSTVHTLIVGGNGCAIGLLQYTDKTFASPNAEHSRAAIVSFCVFFLIYAVLRVLEVLIMYSPNFLSILCIEQLTRNQAPMCHFIAHISHLFGALALLMLVSLISPILTLTVAPLWLAWLFAVMYFCIPKLICGNTNHPGDADLQLSQTV